MDNKTESYNWGWVDAILLGLIWTVLLHPFVGLALGAASLPERTGRRYGKSSRGKKTPGIITAINVVILSAFLSFQLIALHGELTHRALPSPGPVRELQGSATPTSLHISWLASGEDEYTGKSRSYMGYAMKPGPISRFSPYGPADAGTLHSFELELTPSSRERQFAARAWAINEHDKKSSETELEVVVPAISGVFYEDDPTLDAWTTEGKWAATDAIDSDCPKVGKWWSNFFYEKDVQESITGSWIDLPDEQPTELIFLAYCDLLGEDHTILEVKSEQKDWTSLKTYQGTDKYLGIQRIPLDAWQGQRIQLRFRLKSSEGGGRGFSFSNLLVRKVEALVEDDELEQQS